MYNTTTSAHLCKVVRVNHLVRSSFFYTAAIMWNSLLRIQLCNIFIEIKLGVIYGVGSQIYKEMFNDI